MHPLWEVNSFTSLLLIREVEKSAAVVAPVIESTVVGARVVGAPVVGAPVVGASMVEAPVVGAPVVVASVNCCPRLYCGVRALAHKAPFVQRCR